MFISEKKLLKIGLYSNALYVLLLFLFDPDGINITKVLISSTLLFSAISVGIICLKNLKSLKQLPRTAILLFKLIMLWGFIVIARGFSFSLQDIVTNFGNVYMALAWLTPALIIIGLKIENWSIIFKAIWFMFKLMIFAYVLFLFKRTGLSEEWSWLLRPLNFVILIGAYKTGLIKKITLLIILSIYLAVAIITGFRIEFIFLGVVVLFICLDKISYIKVKKSILKYIIITFLAIFTFIFTAGYEYFAQTIAIIVEYQDSRTFLYTELMNDMSFTEKLFGRGSLGTYYSDFFDRTRRYYEITGHKSWAGDSSIRITTEVGYLQMILKGGFIMLFLNTSIAFYSSYLGIFKSNSKFIRRLSFYVLILSMLSIISFRPAFTPTFILFWISIGTILIEKNRQMTDQEIKSILKLK